MTIVWNKFFLGFATIYLSSAAYLLTAGVFESGDLIFTGLIFGLFFPGLAWFLCRKAEPLPITARGSGQEMLALLGCIALVFLYLTWGSGFIDRTVVDKVAEFPGKDVVFSTVKKLLVFVAIPFLVFAKGFGYAPSELGFTKNFKKAFSRRNILILLVFSILFLGLQFLIGQAAKPIFRGDYSFSAVVIGTLVLYPLLVVAVGLVEEFFYRVIVQTRVAAWFKSEAAGLFIMALLFGLSHAPGLYLRGAGDVTTLGGAPGLIDAVTYTVAILAMSGLVFGVIWMKTRNLYILMLIHATVDLLPGLPKFIEGLGLN